MTGAAIPNGADAVIEKEKVIVQDGLLLIKEPVSKGRHIRYKGEEIRQGTRVDLFGTIVTPGVVGFLAGLGAIGGDALASFLKRRLNIAPGAPLIIFDQLDYVFGFLILTSMLTPWRWSEILFLLAFTFILHPLSNLAAYWLKIKKTYWW